MIISVFLFYGGDARISTETTLSSSTLPYQVDLDDDQTKIVTGLTEACQKIAKNYIGKYVSYKLWQENLKGEISN